MAMNRGLSTAIGRSVSAVVAMVRSLFLSDATGSTTNTPITGLVPTLAAAVVATVASISDRVRRTLRIG